MMVAECSHEAARPVAWSLIELTLEGGEAMLGVECSDCGGQWSTFQEIAELTFLGVTQSPHE